MLVKYRHQTQPCSFQVYAGQKAGGQALIGGIDCMVSRNFFGAQVRQLSNAGICSGNADMAKPRTEAAACC